MLKKSVKTLDNENWIKMNYVRSLTMPGATKSMRWCLQIKLRFAVQSSANCDEKYFWVSVFGMKTDGATPIQWHGFWTWALASILNFAWSNGRLTNVTDLRTILVELSDKQYRTRKKLTFHQIFDAWWERVFCAHHHCQFVSHFQQGDTRCLDVKLEIRNKTSVCCGVGSTV